MKFSRKQAVICCISFLFILFSSLLLSKAFQNVLFNFACGFKPSFDVPIWEKRIDDWLGADRYIWILIFLLSVFYYPLENFFQRSMKKISENSQLETKTEIIGFACYFLLNLLTVCLHEHWADEAQAWMIAKTLSAKELFTITPFEGHPVLWYFLIMPFAKLGLPYNLFSFISLVIVTIGAWIFVRKSNFSVLLKILILFSPVFTFYSPVIARPYCLVCLELVCFCVFYKNRKNNPVMWGVLIAFMLQTHVFLAGLCGILALQMLYDFIREKNIKLKLQTLCGGLIIAVSAVLLLFELVDRNSFSTQRSGVELILNFLKTPQVFSAVKAHMNIMEMIAGSEILGSVLIVVFIFSIIPLFWKVKKSAWQELLIVLAAGGYLVFVSFIFRPCSLNHAWAYITINCSTMYVLYNALNDCEKNYLSGFSRKAVLLLLLITTIFTLNRSVSDILNPFSNAKAMAKYMNENYSEDDIFVIEREFAPVISIIGYLDDKIEVIYSKDNQPVKFVNYGADFPKAGNIKTWQNTTGKNAYFLISEINTIDDDFELVYSVTDQNFADGPFYLFKRKY